MLATGLGSLLGSLNLDGFTLGYYLFLPSRQLTTSRVILGHSDRENSVLRRVIRPQDKETKRVLIHTKAH